MTSTQRLALLRRELEAHVAHNEKLARMQREHDAWMLAGVRAAAWALRLTLGSSGALVALVLFGVMTGSTAGRWAAPWLLSGATIGLLMHGWLVARLERGTRQWLEWLTTTDETLPELPEHLRGEQ